MSNLTVNNIGRLSSRYTCGTPDIIHVSGSFSASGDLNALGSIDVDENLYIDGRFDVGGRTIVSGSVELKDTLLISGTLAASIHEPSASLHASGATIAGSLITSQIITSDSTIPDYHNARLFAGDDGTIAIDTNFTLTIGKDSNLKIEGDDPDTTGGGGQTRLR